MTKTEFRAKAEEVFAEALPKVRIRDRNEAISLLMTELQEAGLDIEDDEFEEDVGSADEDDEG